VSSTARAALLALAGIAALGLLWAVSRRTPRGSGSSATIDGRTYELEGAYSKQADAERAARRIRASWTKKGTRGSVRVLRKLYRGVSPLWVVYTRERRAKESHEPAPDS